MAEGPTYAERKRARDVKRAIAHKRKKMRFEQFVARNNLSCFKCGATTGPWSMAHRESNGHKWAFCSNCARKHREASVKRAAEGDQAGTSEP